MTPRLTPADQAALEIGHLFMRAHGAEQQAAILQQRVAELEAKASDVADESATAER